MNSLRWTGRPLWAEIDLDALAHNVGTLARMAEPASLCAVIKANAYGHGAVPVGAAALEAGASSLAVVSVDEGEELRRAGIEAPVLILGFSSASEAERIVDLHLTPTVCAMQTALALSRFAAERGVQQKLHIELESGLNRYGLPLEELVAFAQSVRTLPNIEIEGVYTHFAAAEEGDQRFTRAQYDLLLEASRRLPWIPVRHSSPTAGVLALPEMALDMVRAGIGIYGYHPAPDCGEGIELKPVLSLKSRVARLCELKAGDTVGYGRAWTAENDARIALVMCGYADGLRRGLSGKADVLVRGQRAPIAGRIAMDMCMVDVTGVPGVAPDDEVVIIGRQGDERIDADELASRAGTISWEILAGISARVPRLYLRDGAVISATTLNERATVPLAAEPTTATS